MSQISYSMTVGLPAATKDSHMSRCVELLESETESLDQEGVEAMLRNMLGRLQARSGAIEMRFTYFVRKTAPTRFRRAKSAQLRGLLAARPIRGGAILVLGSRSSRTSRIQ